LDAVSSWWVNLFGHSHPLINEALAAQLSQLEHVMLAGATHAPVVELSERLRARPPTCGRHASPVASGGAPGQIPPTLACPLLAKQGPWGQDPFCEPRRRLSRRNHRRARRDRCADFSRRLFAAVAAGNDRAFPRCARSERR